MLTPHSCQPKKKRRLFDPTGARRPCLPSARVCTRPSLPARCARRHADGGGGVAEPVDEDFGPLEVPFEDVLQVKGHEEMVRLACVRACVCACVPRPRIQRSMASERRRRQLCPDWKIADHLVRVQPVQHDACHWVRASSRRAAARRRQQRVV